MRLFLCAGVLLVAGSNCVVADEWTVTRLQGTVLELDNDQWAQLDRGDVVSDDRVIQSLNGRATFVRGGEQIELGRNSIIQIMDREGQQYTVVANHQGSVAVDAEARNVEHFSVVTPVLAAIVKGTAFTVINAGPTSTLEVTRGQVQMHDTNLGGSVSVGEGQRIEVDGRTRAVVAPIATLGTPAPTEMPQSMSMSQNDSDPRPRNNGAVIVSPPGDPDPLPDPDDGEDGDESGEEDDGDEDGGGEEVDGDDEDDEDEHDGEDYTPPPGKVKHDHDDDGIADH